MTNLIKTIFSLALVIQLSVPSLSQSLSGSAYNIFGVGSLDQQGLVPFQSMGNTGIGSRSEENVNLKNPAALNSITGHSQIFDIGFYFTNLNQYVGDESFNTSYGGMNGLNYWFRSNEKLAFSFGAAKFSDATYDITDTNANFSVLSNYDSRHIGEGGISQVYFGAGYTLFENFNVGARVNFLFGSLRNTESLFLSELFTNLTVEDKESFLKTTLDFGAQYEFKMGENSSLTLGATARTGGVAKINSESTIISSTASSDTLVAEGSSSLRLPPKYGIGASMKFASWQFNLDYEFERWSLGGNMEGYTYKDRFIVGLGVEFQKDRFSDTYVDRMSFRLGAGVQSNYIEIDQTDYLIRSYSLGLGLPINRGSRINLGYQFLSNGTEENELIYEQAHTISLSFSIKDIWFRKSAFD